MKPFRVVFVFLFAVYAHEIFAQQFGGNPPSLKWRQINTDTARIIFPVGLDSQAQQVMAAIHALSHLTLPTAGGRQRKVNVVFQNQTTISNGYVSLAPFRSEFLLTADQNSFELGSLPWTKQLVIHEYRHVEQYNNYRIGLSKVLFYLFGEGGQELGNSLTVPNWYWEGDAVYQETMVSRQGRGRLPFFFDGYRSLWAADKKYSYLKLRNGSLRDYTPDHYPLGYMLVAYGREKYGTDFWKKVTLDAASFKGLFYPLQNAVKRYAGISFTHFREDALNYFNAQQPSSAPQDSAAIYARDHIHFVADEEFPNFLDKDHIVFVRTTYKQIPSFVVYDTRDGSEDRLHTRSVSLDNYFSCNNGRIVYAAYEPDLRWNWRDYGVIRVLDIQSRTDRKITSGTKYFSPDISADGKQIVAVNLQPNGHSELHILNAADGRIEKIVPNGAALFFTYPKFYKDGQVVAAVRNQKGEMALGVFNISDGAVRYLTPFSMNVIGFPSVQNDTVYFGASHQGQDRFFAAANNHLYSMEIPTGSNSAGNYQLQHFADEYSWTSFSAVGYKMFHAGRDRISMKEISADEWKRPLTDQQIHSLENGMAAILDSLPLGNYLVGKYSQSFHLINFHSLRPYISDPDYTFSLASENVLNTLESELYVDYNRNEHSTQVGADAVYSQLFPWIDAGVDYTFNRNTLFGIRKIFWNEAETKIGMSIPLNFSKARSFTSLQFGADLVYNQRYFQGSYKDSFNTSGFAYVHAYLNFSNQVQQARQQIFPRFAETLALVNDHAVSTVQGNQFLASGYLYLPGIAYTHNLVLGGAFQQRDSLRQVGFSNSFPFSRGYSAENFYRMIRFAGNYHFPLFYPDWGFGGIAYFLRVRANVYYDYTHVLDFFADGSRFEPSYRSFGAEVYIDSKWWNQLAVSFGFRYSRLLDNDFEGRGPNQWEFILPVNILSR